MAGNASKDVKDAVDRILCFPGGYPEDTYAQDLRSVASIISRAEIAQQERANTFPEIARAFLPSAVKTAVCSEVPANATMCVDSTIARRLAAQALAPGYAGICEILRGDSLGAVIGYSSDAPIRMLNFHFRSDKPSNIEKVSLNERTLNVLDESSCDLLGAVARELSRSKFIPYSHPGLKMCIPRMNGDRDVNIRNFAGSMFRFREGWEAEIEHSILSSLCGPSSSVAQLSPRPASTADSDAGQESESQDGLTCEPSHQYCIPAYEFATWDETFEPRNAGNNALPAPFNNSTKPPSIDDKYIRDMFNFLECQKGINFRLQKPRVRFGDQLEKNTGAWVWLVPPEIAGEIRSLGMYSSYDSRQGKQQIRSRIQFDTGSGFFYEVSGVWNAFYFLVHGGVTQAPSAPTDKYRVGRTLILCRKALCCGLRYVGLNWQLNRFGLPHNDRFYGSPFVVSCHSGNRGGSAGVWHATLNLGQIRGPWEARDSNCTKFVNGIVAVDAPYEPVVKL